MGLILQESDNVSCRIERIAPDDVAVATVERELRAFNEAAVGPYAYEPLALRDPAGVVCGGFLGYAGLGWLNVSTLWVAPALRRRGYGRALLEAGEALGRERGCAHAFLFTYSFQAPDFYRAVGYRQFATLEDFPPGAQRLFFRKHLEQTIAKAPSGDEHT
jgi:ribosomal protein S18 acetylase RimI-like enzyme